MVLRSEDELESEDLGLKGFEFRGARIKSFTQLGLVTGPWLNKKAVTARWNSIIEAMLHMKMLEM